MSHLFNNNNIDFSSEPRAAHSAQNELCTGKKPSGTAGTPMTATRLVGIVRVEEEGQVLINSGLVEGNAVMDDALVDGVQIEQVQGVGAPLVAGNRQLVQPGGVLLAASSTG